MLKRYLIIILYLSACFLPLSISDASAKNVKLLLAYEDKQNFPFYMDNSISVSKYKPGVSIELLKMMESELPLEINFLRMPWKRCKANLQSGKVDGIFNASFNSARIKLGLYPMIDGNIDKSKRITTLNYFLYSKNDSLIKWNAEKHQIFNLEGKVCAPLGYSIVKNLKKWGIPVFEKPRCYDCLRLLTLNSKKVSAVATLEYDGDSYLSGEDEKIANIKKIFPALIRKPYFLMISRQFAKKNPGMAERIWNAVEKLREQHLKEIMQKYIGS